MFHDSISTSVLLVTVSENARRYFTELLPSGQFHPFQTATSAGEARRVLSEAPPDIVIIDTPLKDEFGTQLALSVVEHSGAGVLLFVKNDVYEQISYEMEHYGVFVLAKPVSRQSVFQAVKLLVASQARMRSLEERNWTLEEKMKELRMVNRAKCLLIEHLKMSEQDAQRYIEKTAMDHCVKRGEIARNIIKMYDD